MNELAITAITSASLALISLAMAAYSLYLNYRQAKVYEEIKAIRLTIQEWKHQHQQGTLEKR